MTHFTSRDDRSCGLVTTNMQTSYWAAEVTCPECRLNHRNWMQKYCERDTANARAAQALVEAK